MSSAITSSMCTPATAPVRARAGAVSRTALRCSAVAIPRRTATVRPAARVESTATLTVQAVATEVAHAPQKIVHLVDAETYQPFLESHADKVVVMDFYAVWCGPCKVIAPQLDQMASEADPSKIVFAKMDCGATNESKKLAMSLNIKALPTFHIHRGGKQVDSMTGAKLKSLQELIAKHM